MHRKKPIKPQSINRQMELMEDLKPRLETLKQWETQYPQYFERIHLLLNKGLSCNAQLRAMGELDRGSNTVMAAHDAFLSEYKFLCKFIQDDS